MSASSIGYRPGLELDFRNDLGYGRTQASFHKQRSKSSTFPYTVDDNHDNSEDFSEYDEDLLRKFIKKTLMNPQKSDSLIGVSVDKTSFVSGNTPLGELAVAKGISPFPKMYSKRIQVGGGVNKPMAYDPGQYERTGTYHGWSRAPIDNWDVVKFSEIEDGEDPTLVKIRKIVRDILSREEK